MTIFSLILAFVAHRYQYVYYTEGDPDLLIFYTYILYIYFQESKIPIME